MVSEYRQIIIEFRRLQNTRNFYSCDTCSFFSILVGLLSFSLFSLILFLSIKEHERIRDLMGKSSVNDQIHSVESACSFPFGGGPVFWSVLLDASALADWPSCLCSATLVAGTERQSQWTIRRLRSYHHPCRKVSSLQVDDRQLERVLWELRARARHQLIESHTDLHAFQPDWMRQVLSMVCWCWVSAL